MARTLSRLWDHQSIYIWPPASTTHADLDSVGARLQVRVENARIWITASRYEGDALRSSTIDTNVGESLAAVSVH